MVGVTLFLLVILMSGGLGVVGNHDAHQLYIRGHVDLALERIKAIHEAEGLAGPSLNTAVCVLVAAGRYREALDLAQRRAKQNADPLLLINGAEAAYNLGDWEGARAMLAPLEKVRIPFVATGLILQRAWIAAHTGQGSIALRLCDSCVASSLPPEYETEWHFTRAAALLALEQFDAAMDAVENGSDCVVRVSSLRNAWMLMGRIKLAAGDAAAAQAFLQKGADHPYRWQGGEGLLALADALERLDRKPEAVEALKRVLRQDPESESSRKAATRLGVEPPNPFPRLLADSAAAQSAGT